MNDRRRELPSVDRLLRDPAVQQLLEAAPRSAVVRAVRETLDAARTRRAGAPSDWAAEVREHLASAERASIRPVLNATGVVLHTNLGPGSDGTRRARRCLGHRGRILQSRIRSFDRHPRQSKRPLPGHSSRSHRRWRCAGREQCCGRAPPRACHSCRGPGRPHLARRADRDRWIVPNPRHPRPERRQIEGDRHHQPDSPRGLPPRARRRCRRHSHGPPVQLRTARVRGESRPCRPGRSRRRVRSSVHLRRGQRAHRRSVALGSHRRAPRRRRVRAREPTLVLFSGDKLLGGPQAGCVVGAPEAVRRCREHPLPAPCGRTR